MELLNGEWGVNEIDFNIIISFLAFDSCRLTANKLTVQMECQEFNLFPCVAAPSTVHSRTYEIN